MKQLNFEFDEINSSVKEVFVQGDYFEGERPLKYNIQQTLYLDYYSIHRTLSDGMKLSFICIKVDENNYKVLTNIKHSWENNFN